MTKDAAASCEAVVAARTTDFRSFAEPFVLTIFTVTVAVLVPSGVPLSATVYVKLPGSVLPLVVKVIVPLVVSGVADADVVKLHE